MESFFNWLEYLQNHGGIMAVSLLAILGILVVRALDWVVWHRELKAVSKRASEDIGQHELNLHMEEVLERINITRNRRAEDKKGA